MSNNFAVTIEPEQIRLNNHTNGSLTVMVISESNFLHLSFATPYEAWKWSNALTAELAKQMTDETLEGAK